MKNYLHRDNSQPYNYYHKFSENIMFIINKSVKKIYTADWRPAYPVYNKIERCKNIQTCLFITEIHPPTFFIKIKIEKTLLINVFTW